MAFVITRPLYPSPAITASSTAFITSHVVTVTSAAATDPTAFNTNPPGAVDLVTFDVQGFDVRTYWEGSTPTSSAGHLLPAGTAYTWSVVQYNNAKFILDASATGNATIVASPFSGS